MGHKGEPLLGHTRIPLPSTRYARVPQEVYTNSRLDARDVRVYCALASACWQRAIAQVGKRFLASQCQCAERKVIGSLKNLEAAGHIRECPSRGGQRAQYELVSPVFGQKQRAGINVIVPSLEGQPRLVQSAQGAVRRRSFECQQMGFGKILGLVVREGEPVFAETTEMLLDLKLGADESPRLEMHGGDFILCPSSSGCSSSWMESVMASSSRLRFGRHPAPDRLRAPNPMRM